MVKSTLIVLGVVLTQLRMPLRAFFVWAFIYVLTYFIFVFFSAVFLKLKKLKNSNNLHLTFYIFYILFLKITFNPHSTSGVLCFPYSSSWYTWGRFDTFRFQNNETFRFLGEMRCKNHKKCSWHHFLFWQDMTCKKNVDLEDPLCSLLDTFYQKVPQRAF